MMIGAVVTTGYVYHPTDAQVLLVVTTTTRPNLPVTIKSWGVGDCLRVIRLQHAAACGNYPATAKNGRWFLMAFPALIRTPMHGCF